MSGDGITVAVADTGNNRVRLYTIKGQQLSVVGMRGKGNARSLCQTQSADNPVLACDDDASSE